MVVLGRVHHKDYIVECKCFSSVLTNVQRKMKVISLVEIEGGERTRSIPSGRGQ